MDLLLFASGGQVAARSWDEGVMYVNGNCGTMSIPLVHNQEEPADYCASGGIWIKLAYSSHKHRPCDTSKESVHIGINSSS